MCHYTETYTCYGKNKTRWHGQKLLGLQVLEVVCTPFQSVVTCWLVRYSSIPRNQRIGDFRSESSGRQQNATPSWRVLTRNDKVKHHLMTPVCVCVCVKGGMNFQYCINKYVHVLCIANTITENYTGVWTESNQNTQPDIWQDMHKQFTALQRGIVPVCNASMYMCEHPLCRCVACACMRRIQ